MKSSGQVDLAEDFAFFNGAGEMVEVWEIVGILEGEVVESTKVPARPLRAVRLGLEVKGTAVVMGFPRVNSFNDAQPFHFHPRCMTGHCLWASWEEGPDFTADWRTVSSVNCMLHGMIHLSEIWIEKMRVLINQFFVFCRNLGVSSARQGLD